MTDDGQTTERTAGGRLGVIARCGGLGALAALMVDGALVTTAWTGGYSFAGWAAEKVHRRLMRPARYGVEAVYGRPGETQEDTWLGLRGDLRAVYAVGTLAVMGAVLGGLMGIIAAIAGGRRGHGDRHLADARSQSPCPLRWPLGLALIGVVFHGYVLGFAAVVLARYCRPKRRIGRLGKVLIVVLGVLVVVLWTAGLELDFSPGWSSRYLPWSRWLYVFKGAEEGLVE